MNSQEEEAALVLCSMKNSKVDYQTALQLEETSTPFVKRLTRSDTKKTQGRLLFKYNHVVKFLHPLLRPSEVDKIKKRGMIVCVYDCYGRMYEMVFTLWGSKAYVITTRNWFEFCVDHGLKRVLDWVTIWMFRHNVTGRICFVITSERRFLEKAVEPVFDLPLAARKKRTKSCSSGRNLKRRRLNDDDGVIRVN
ncbi:TF-B3 domain-containing protein [Heracleum sosnowskyi]|uniref:TF-B3 domain-containing protein n=1 Tax=Heracleum sosnowskyi TaxID=360622 RepID=A0AAD8JCN5_9APIA|nr:TF-B3 domain-containing protein [Heracleum sosnowskyi]